MEVEIRVRGSVVTASDKDLILRQKGMMPDYWHTLAELEESEAAMEAIAREIGRQADEWDEARYFIQEKIDEWRNSRGGLDA